MERFIVFAYLKSNFIEVNLKSSMERFIANNSDDY